eukprot:16433638-Heterocapsa_arctica.AAC.1
MRSVKRPGSFLIDTGPNLAVSHRDPNKYGCDNGLSWICRLGVLSMRVKERLVPTRYLTVSTSYNPDRWRHKSNH